MKRLAKPLIGLLLLSSLVAIADQLVIKPQNQGDVIYVSGGVGSDEKEAMDAARPEYNVHLLFAQGRGEYLSNVKVSISDANNHAILDTIADGPMLFVNLTPGSYSVRADLDGRVLQKKLNVTGKKSADITFLWAE